MLKNNEVDISDFIKITNNGVEIASYVQVREALVKRYKEAYGSDIDLSTATADGVFLNNLALIINNVLQSFKNIYNNLDVNTASGNYLDHLCSLSNIQRKESTKSTASINITNTGSGASDSFAIGELILVDINGTTWVNKEVISAINSGSTVPAIFECTESGQVEAPANSIYQTLDGSYTDLVINQPNAAIVGLKQESDSDLRARRAQSTGADGVTVLDSLIGALLEISGIRDVYIYNHNGSDSSEEVTMNDTTEVEPHDIYIVVRYEDNITINDDIIGNIIYNKLTPGIRTTTPANTVLGGEPKSSTVVPKLEGSSLDLFSETFSWKKATPIHPAITITLTKLNYYDESEETSIKNNLIEYLNNLKLSTDLTTQQILVQVAQLDPLFLSTPTYSVASVSITGAQNNKYTNPNTYYNYSASDITITYTN